MLLPKLSKLANCIIVRESQSKFKLNFLQQTKLVKISMGNCCKSKSPPETQDLLPLSRAQVTKLESLYQRNLNPDDANFTCSSLFKVLKCAFPENVKEKIYIHHSSDRKSMSCLDFTKLVSNAFRSSKENSLRFIFSAFDLNGDGMHSQDEFNLLINTLRLGDNFWAMRSYPYNFQSFLEQIGRLMEVDSIMDQFGLFKTISGEQRFVRQAMKSIDSFEQGTVRYLIQKSWWDSWKQFSGYDNGSSQSNAPVPERIDNSVLFVDTMNRVLRRDLKENVDFVLVTEAVWKELSEQYGGSPEIKSKYEFIENELKLELHFNQIRVVTVDGSKSKDIKYSVPEHQTLESFLATKIEGFTRRSSIRRGTDKANSIQIDQLDMPLSELELLHDEAIFLILSPAT